MRRMVLVAACAAGMAVPRAQAQAVEGAREIIEVTRYVCATVEKRDRLLAVWDAALVPALNRQGVKQVGVFWTDEKVNNGNAEYATTVFVVAGFPAAEAFVASEERLLADSRFRQEAAEVFGAPMNDPLYDSCSSLGMQGFATCPRVVRVTDSPERILELRIYNSYTIERNASKIAMFEGGGELAIFRACGMPPVFFGRALAGEKLPNLTYLLAFADRASMDAAWKTFRDHPDWLKLKADPTYKDTANKITKILLRPSRGSQL